MIKLFFLFVFTVITFQAKSSEPRGPLEGFWRKCSSLPENNNGLLSVELTYRFSKNQHKIEKSWFTKEACQNSPDQVFVREGIFSIVRNQTLLDGGNPLNVQVVKFEPATRYGVTFYNEERINEMIPYEFQDLWKIGVQRVISSPSELKSFPTLIDPFYTAYVIAHVDSLSLRMGMLNKKSDDSNVFYSHTSSVWEMSSISFFRAFSEVQFDPNSWVYEVIDTASLPEPIDGGRGGIMDSYIRFEHIFSKLPHRLPPIEFSFKKI